MNAKPMDSELARLIILLRLEDGRLPRSRLADLTGVAGNGQRPCDGCGAIIAKGENAVTGIAIADRRNIQLHVACFRIWHAERLGDQQRSPPASR
jgi:hypothetical protein